jgi:D-xylose transport system permease protein
MTAEALAPTPSAADAAPLLSLRNIQKSFGAVHVLRGVDLDVRPGHVTALVGDNGAGKSTLIKGIAGIHAFDEGEYLFDGKPVTVHGPRDANALGIEIVYQDLALCDNLDVVQNMFLGRELGNSAALDEFAMEARARETLDGLSVRTLQSVRTAVASLSGGQRQTVAIARAVLWNSKLVVLDEPTAALGVAQTEQVLRLVRRLADRGLGVILISHNLNDIFEVADDIAVLYLGAMVAQVPPYGCDVQSGGRADHHRPVRRPGPERPGRRAGGGGQVTTQTSSNLGSDAPGPSSPGFGDIVRAYVTKLRGGDLGSLPAILGLVVLVIVFAALRPGRFTDPFNVANLTNQAAAIVVLSMGLVFVLLLGEIDLAAGYTGGTAAAVTGVVMTERGWPWIPSLLACLATGAVIGLLIGLLVARLGIPSFVVTLAFFLGLQGVLLVIIGEGGTIAYRNEVILKLNNDPMPVWLGWALALVGLAAFALVSWLTDSRGARRGSRCSRCCYGRSRSGHWSSSCSPSWPSCRWSAAPTPR